MTDRLDEVYTSEMVNLIANKRIVEELEFILEGLRNNGTQTLSTECHIEKRLKELKGSVGKNE